VQSGTILPRTVSPPFETGTIPASSFTDRPREVSVSM
jgi:hypothetical protein